MAIRRRMPNITHNIGSPNSLARRASLLDELVAQIPNMIEDAKNEKTYIVNDHVRNHYLDGVIDQMNDILEYVRLNNS